MKRIINISILLFIFNFLGTIIVFLIERTINFPNDIVSGIIHKLIIYTLDIPIVYYFIKNNKQRKYFMKKEKLSIKNFISCIALMLFIANDGLMNVGTTLKKITENRVITLFGAGGDRDNKKRPKMAKAAAEFSDYIILTSDNPRTEDPMMILKEVESGLTEINFPKEKYVIIEDREQAIKYAVQEIIRKGDSLLIAGKGHETYQIIGKEKRHFDDRETVKKHLI